MNPRRGPLFYQIHPEITRPDLPFLSCRTGNRFTTDAISYFDSRSEYYVNIPPRVISFDVDEADVVKFYSHIHNKSLSYIPFIQNPPGYEPYEITIRNGSSNDLLKRYSMSYGPVTNRWTVFIDNLNFTDCFGRLNPRSNGSIADRRKSFARNVGCVDVGYNEGPYKEHYRSIVDVCQKYPQGTVIDTANTKVHKFSSFHNRRGVSIFNNDDGEVCRYDVSGMEFFHHCNACKRGTHNSYGSHFQSNTHQTTAKGFHNIIRVFDPVTDYPYILSGSENAFINPPNDEKLTQSAKQGPPRLTRAEINVLGILCRLGDAGISSYPYYEDNNKVTHFLKDCCVESTSLMITHEHRYQDYLT